MTPFVLILSQRRDVFTDAVLGWLSHWGVSARRLDAEAPLAGLSWHFEDGAAQLTLFPEVGAPIKATALTAVWFRRPDLRLRVDPHLPAHLAPALDREWQAARGRALARLSMAPTTLGCPGDEPDKLAQLSAAAAAGLATPATLITSERDALSAFHQEHGPLITKPLDAPTTVSAGQRWWVGAGTERLGEQDIGALPPRLFPTLAQAAVPVAVELRVAYVAGQCTAAAIAPEDGASWVDRRTHAGPLRRVPYALTEEEQGQIQQLMRALGLSFGALDFVVTPDGQLVFLEANPAGQVEEITVATGVSIERQIAAHLAGRGPGGPHGP